MVIMISGIQAPDAVMEEFTAWFRAGSSTLGHLLSVLAPTTVSWDHISPTDHCLRSPSHGFPNLK